MTGGLGVLIVLVIAGIVSLYGGLLECDRWDKEMREVRRKEAEDSIARKFQP